MTDTPVVETIQPVAELFTGAASALWATTYSLDLALFTEFLLTRLGDPPLNVAILADHRRLTASLERIPSERAEMLATVNRRWLLRGVLHGQTFHPKTYLVITASSATLLVGSGNLSADGLDEGREVFTVFRSGTAVGDVAIAAWRGWMRRLVEHVADVTLAERFRDLEDRLPPRPAVAPAVPTPLLHNLDNPIAAQLAAAVARGTAAGVDELMLAAPFYDDDAEAVGRLITDLAPRRVRLFVTDTTSVDGHRLAERLALSNAEVDVAAYEPDQYVHAKLIGVIAGAYGWLLSGSANLSRAALINTARGNGNVEIAVLATLGAQEVRAAFVPPDTSTVARSLNDLTSLSFRPDPIPDLPPIRLATATAVRDGRVEVVTEPPAEPGWLLDDLANRQPLIVEPSGRAVTSGRLDGRLVQLVDTSGDVVSNRVVVDDRTALAEILVAAPDRAGVDRPPEFAAGDLDSPLAQALAWLNRNLVMDVSERTTAAPTGGVAADEARDQADDNLWERLEREQLARDPRANTYGRMWNRTDLADTEPIIELLDNLRARTPTEPAGTPVGRSVLAELLGRHTDSDDGDGDAPRSAVRRWRLSTRIRVRARNALRRWADAQTDPRLVWVDPLAPAGNIAAIAVTLAHLRLDRARANVELTDEDLDDLWLRWLRTFAGTGKGDGWLDQLDSAALTRVRNGFPEWLREATAALCWLVVRPGTGRRERVVDSQPALTAALRHGLIDPTDMTARYLSAVTGSTVTHTQVDKQILEAIDFIDDELWCDRTAAEIVLDALTLDARPGVPSTQVRLRVRGIDDPLLDPRVPRLVIAVRQYRRCDNVALFSDDAGWRITLVDGERIAYLRGLGGSVLESTEELTHDLLEQLTAAAGVLADLFPPGAQVA